MHRALSFLSDWVAEHTGDMCVPPPAVMDAKTAQTIASVVMLTFMLTAGYFVTTIPGWISWLKCDHTPPPPPAHTTYPLLLHMPSSLRRLPNGQCQLHTPPDWSQQSVRCCIPLRYSPLPNALDQNLDVSLSHTCGVCICALQRCSSFLLTSDVCCSADVSFVFYGYGLLLHIEYSGRTIYECAPDLSGPHLHEGLLALPCCRTGPSASSLLLTFCARFSL